MMPRFSFDIPKQQAGTHTPGMPFKCPRQQGARFLHITLLAGSLGHFTEKLRNYYDRWPAVDLFHPGGRPDCTFPVFFLLIDVEQQRKDLRDMPLALQQFRVKLLRTIEQTGTLVIAAQFQQCITALLIVQGVPRNEIPVNPDGAIDLAALPEQIAQGKMRFKGIGSHLERADKDINGLVGLFGQQIIQPSEKFRTGEVVRMAIRDTPAPPGRKPPAECGHGQKQPGQLVHDRSLPATLPGRTQRQAVPEMECRQQDVHRIGHEEFRVFVM